MTPRVISAVREHLQCTSLTGAELEDDGGGGTAGSHWEQRLFEGMQPLFMHVLQRVVLRTVQSE